MARPAESVTRPIRKRRGARLAQCSGFIAYMAFSNGVILLFLTACNLSTASVLFLLALPDLIQFFLLVPGAFYADRSGIKRLGLPGLALTVLGFAALPCSLFLEGTAAYLLIAGGVLLFGAGMACFAAGWYALLSPLVPQPERGRFFGRMRFWWQMVGLAFGGFCSLTLSAESSRGAFLAPLGVLTAGLVLRMLFYSRIPELDPPHRGTMGLRAALGESVRVEGYLSFCCYAFLLTLFTYTAPSLFALVLKKTLLYGDDDVIWMNNLLMLGSVLGFLLGGKAVDRLGTKSVFLSCHLGYGILFFLFLLRDLSPLPQFLHLGAVHFLFGLVAASSSIAIATETLALLPVGHKSMSASLNLTFLRGGQAVSGLIIAWALKLGILSESWSLFGATLGAYDSILLACGVMVLLLVVTLGLVPSVVRSKAILNSEF